MSTITRSEASHRLKVASALANRAAVGARDGEWGESVDVAKQAISVLQKLLPHLEEADAAEPQKLGSLKYDPPIVNRVGGMGYRGSNGNHKPKPAPRPAIVTPPPPVPIVTPAPAETVTFDLRKIDGRPEFMEWQLECFRAGSPSVRTDAELEASTLFWRLPPTTQEKVVEKWREIKAPVVLRVRSKNS